MRTPEGGLQLADFTSKFEVKDHPSMVLLLEDLLDVVELDCSEQPHIEEIELVDCPKLQRVVFDDGNFRQAPRHFRVGGSWSESIHIDGSIGSIAYHDARSRRDISIGERINDFDPRMQPGNGALITASLDELQQAAAKGGPHDLLFLPDAFDPSTMIEIGVHGNLPFRNLGISGPAAIEHLHIRCPYVGVQSITLRGLQNLKSIRIDGFTRILDVHGSPNLREVRGQGDVLRTWNFDGVHSQVGGIWLRVEGVDPRSSLALSSEEIRTLEDVAHARLLVHDYERGCEWAELLGIDVHDVMEGLPILQMLEEVTRVGPRMLELMDEWFVRLPTLAEQFHALRLVAALASRDLPPELLWRARDSILASNRLFSEASIHLIEDRSKFSTWHEQVLGHLTPAQRRRRELARLEKDKLQWYVPDHAMMPFARLDTEIWVETGGVSEASGELMPDELFEAIPMHTLRCSIEAIRELRTSSPQRIRQEGLMERLIINLASSSNVTAFEQMALNISMLDEEVQSLVFNQFVPALIDAPLRINAKAAIAATLLQYGDDMRIRAFMSNARSDRDIVRTEARTLHALSLAGPRAFSQGIVPKIGWPFLENWRIIHDKR